MCQTTLPSRRAAATRASCADAPPAASSRASRTSGATRLRAEELDKALLELFIALPQLLWIDGKPLEVRHLRLVGRILRLWLASVTVLALVHDLQHPPGDGEV